MRNFLPLLLCAVSLQANPLENKINHRGTENTEQEEKRENPLPEDASVSSTNASYDGNALVLTGHVLLDHGLGKMAAEMARLERQEAGSPFPFSLIHLQNRVHLALKTAAEVHCEKALLDFTTMKGVLTSSGEGKVIYSDPLKKKGESLRVAGKTAEIGFKKKEEKNDFEIDTILAKEEVAIDFLDAYHLSADRALFRKAEANSLLTAYPKDSATPCRLTHESDLIDAESVDVDLAANKISLLRPKGTLLSSLLSGMQKGEVKFRCDHLFWDHAKNLLHLTGHIQIVESVLGNLLSDGEVEIQQLRKKKERQLKTIRTKGKSTLTFIDNGEARHQLTCWGPLVFDREKLIATIDTPKERGHFVKEKQIIYLTEGLLLNANQAHVEYAALQNSLRPVSVSLRGDIRLISQDPEKPRASVADRLHFSPTTRTLILSADPGKKVLYCDDTQAVRIAAQEVHLTKDLATGEEKVQGVGNVQFKFTDEENNLFTKLFPKK